jgi:hypothetical protein
MTSRMEKNLSSNSHTSSTAKFADYTAGYTCVCGYFPLSSTDDFHA